MPGLCNDLIFTRGKRKVYSMVKLFVSRRKIVQAGFGGNDAGKEMEMLLFSY